jgi:UMF1 family MFS transporter
MILSWAMYDWANSAFATTVMAGFFPIFFKKYWSAGFSVTESTYALGMTNSVASLALALLAPTLGAVADQGAYRKRFLMFFTLVGVAASTGLGLVSQGQWIWAVGLFALGIIGFNGALPFYDALLMQVASEKEFDRVSALGYGLGYLGGGLLFTLNVVMYSKPEWFGIADGAAAIKISFITVGVWWLLFSLPLFMNVPEWPARIRQGWIANVRSSAAELVRQVRELKDHKPLLYFLLAFLLYNDAVNTIIKMAVDYGMSIGLADGDLIKALLLVQFVGFPAAIAFGRVAEKHSPAKGIWICLAAYLGVTVYAYFLSTAAEFFVIAAVIGLVQGGIQALSRSYYARLVTPEESAQYFGFFNMIGKFSSILGPFLVGWVGVATGNPRMGILVLTVFFVAGGFFLIQSGRRTT